MLIDTHIHLDAPEFDVDRETLITSAGAAGLTRFVIPAVEVRNFDAVANLAARLSGSACAFGIHPLYVDRASDDDLGLLRQRLEAGGAVAVGEIGLDGFEPEPDPARRERFLAEQLRFAREFDLPVILHVRRAQDRVLKYLRRHRVRGGIVHAFNGSAQQAQAFIKLGFCLGFGGAMTYSGSTRIRAFAASLPSDSLVIETDAPDIPPVWRAGGRNEPTDLPRIAGVLAELRGETLEAIAATTTANACRALKLGV